jgi:RNA polymerase sigma-70 factor (ECF subfamily)
MSQPSDVHSAIEQLVSRAATGDRDARHELFVRFREDAYKVAFRITGRHADAADVVQDAFIKAFDGLTGFQAEASFKTWLLRIVANRALDALRKRKIRLAAPIDSDDGAGEAGRLADPRAEPAGARLDRQELGVRLQAAIEKLSPDHRSVFALYATGDKTYGEIAEMLGIPIGTVMSRLYHARRKLRELLPDLAAEFGGEGVAEEARK